MSGRADGGWKGSLCGAGEAVGVRKVRVGQGKRWRVGEFVWGRECGSVLEGFG